MNRTDLTLRPVRGARCRVHCRKILWLEAHGNNALLPGAEIAGIRISDLKRALSEARIRPISSATIGYQLGLLEPHLSRRLVELAAAGVIAHEETRDGLDFWTLGDTGVRMLASRIQRPMSRDDARNLLDRVVAAARSANADDSLAYCVARIAVFGSYLGNAHELGDLDIGFELVERPAADGRDRYKEARKRAPRDAGIVGRATWPRQEVMARLAVDARKVALHEISEVVEIGTPYMEVYAYDASAGADAAPDMRTVAPERATASEPAERTPASPASYTCTDPTPPPYAPDRAPRRPRRAGEARRRGSVASEEEIALQNAWANGLSIPEILEAYTPHAHTERTLRDLIAALYHWADHPDTDPLPDGCRHVEADVWFDPEMGGFRRDDARPKLYSHGVRRVRAPGSVRAPARPRKLASLSSMVGGHWDVSWGPVRVQARITAAPDPERAYKIDLSILEDNARYTLASISRMGVCGPVTEIYAASERWANRARRIYADLVPWAERLTAALGGAGYHTVAAIDLHEPPENASVAARALDVAPLRAALSDALAAYPKAANSLASDERVAAVVAIRNSAPCADETPGLDVSLRAVRTPYLAETALTDRTRGLGHTRGAEHLRPAADAWAAPNPAEALGLEDFRVIVPLPRTPQDTAACKEASA